MTTEAVEELGEVAAGVAVGGVVTPVLRTLVGLGSILTAKNIYINLNSEYII